MNASDNPGKLQKKFRVFISYAREDENKAIRLYNDLKNSTLPVEPWLDKKDLLPGQDWDIEIKESIRKSDFFIPLFSSTSIVKRGYIQREFKVAVDTLQDIPPGDIFVIPVRLDECDIKYNELAKFQRQDLFPEWYEGLVRIIKSIETSIKEIQIRIEQKNARTNQTVPPKEGSYEKISDLPINANGNPVIIQSTFGAKGNYELVIPKLTNGIYSFYRDNDNKKFLWYGLSCTDDVGHVDAISLIQSNFGNPRNIDFSIRAGHLQVIARVNNSLQHFSRYLHPLTGEDTWKSELDIGTGVSGNPVLIQSTYGLGRGHFVLIVPNSKLGIDLYWRDNDNKKFPWYGPFNFGKEIGHVDAVSMIQSNLVNPGNLEVVGRVGPTLQHFSGCYDPEKEEFSWQQKTNIGTGVSGNPVLIQSRFGTRGNYEIIIPNSEVGIDMYRRNNYDPNLPWYGPFNFGKEIGHVDAVSMIQSNLVNPGNLEVVGRVGPTLQHFSGCYDPEKEEFSWNYLNTDPK